MSTAVEVRKPGEGRWTIEAIGSALVLLLAFAAFDDITTDKATDFTVEYSVLAGCGLWLLVVSIRLLRRGHQILSGASLVALTAALWGQRGIRTGITRGLWPEYLVMVAAFVWFAALTLLLFFLDSRTTPESSARTRRTGRL